ncbi:DUF4123 domain-containing protein [Pseudomonas sp. 21LCFQ02]|uniref:DUF4123 domain-containing protein n=1 Tax=Pseudomonas sp. 21LCFQ02 TaxID=2957505 RepID=UPI00209A938E|nr:DUF4123 domain-containing protein [Pseudomonas sp. 21LCFQ02]MCO8169297.1 DUF4123 domain-containing protein [Pseudomonas sp. 21LCFQ02]
MNLTHYLLVDGLLMPDALRQLHGRQENLDIEPLYLGTRWADFQAQGPILVQASASLRDAWPSDPHWQSCASLLASGATLLKIANHLRHFICPPDALGNASLLRFSDPVVMHHWLSSFAAGQLDLTLGPIDELRVAAPRQPWQAAKGIAAFRVTGERQPWAVGFALQGAQQLEAFEQATVFVFQQRLYNWLLGEYPTAFAGQSPNQIDQWLEQSLSSGREWGLITEFGFATWARYRLALGEDFVTAPDGAWQQWLRQQTAPRCTSPEQQLDDFDLHHNSLTASLSGH